MAGTPKQTPTRSQGGGGSHTWIIGVLGLAKATRGAKSWIPLPGFHLQPSEIGKVLLVVAASGFLVEHLRDLGRQTTARVMRRQFCT